MALRSKAVHDALTFAAVIAAIFIAVGCARDSGSGSSPALAASWTVQSSGTTASLRGVSAVNDRTAWACGANATVLRTIDGGATWMTLPVPGAGRTDFRDIEALGPNEAVVMGIDRPARMFRTTDGGRTWTETFTNDSPGIFLDGLAFADAENGLAFGDPMDGRLFLIATSDGGASWTPLPQMFRPAVRDGEAAFAASGTSVAVSGRVRIWLVTGGTVSRVWRTEDGGLNWEAVPSGLAEGAPSTGGFSVAFLDRRSGIAVGGDYRAEAAAVGNASTSSDGGKTWVPVVSGRPGGFREAVAFVPRSRPAVAVTVGPSGSDLSRDLGRTWTRIDGPVGFHALSFAKRGRTGWAVGRNGIVAKLALSSSPD
jgi:photosystem II stability/assembly factor-like uncharacterized protein